MDSNHRRLSQQIYSLPPLTAREPHRLTTVQSPKSKVQSPRSKVQGPKSKVQSPKSKVQGPRSKVQGPKSKVQGPRSKVQGPKSKVQSRRFKVQGPKSKVQSPRSKVQGPKSKVQGLGCSLWTLDFRLGTHLDFRLPLTWSRRGGSNSQHPVYKTGALPLSYAGPAEALQYIPRIVICKRSTPKK